VRRIEWKEKRSILSTFKCLHEDLRGIFVETEVSKSSALVLVILIYQHATNIAIKVHILICGFYNVFINKLIK